MDNQRKLLLDQGLAPRAAGLLRERGFDAIHVSEAGLHRADDVDLLRYAAAEDKVRFGEFFHFLLDRGIYIAPSQFEAGLVFAAHSDVDIQATVSAIRDFFAR